MSTLLRWAGRLLLALLLVAIALLSPVAYVELACRGTPVADGYEPILPPEHRRPESATLLTYPEWHIVHAYEDYAEVIRTGDPQDFGYLSAIGGFWSSYCALSRATAAHGGADRDYRTMVDVIGVSFTAELLLKAGYEETLGRIATWVRGEGRTPLDGLSARQAADYAAFLQQVPWYRWDFLRSATELDDAATAAFRDRERDLALGLEYRAKAAYAQAIAAAVAATGNDELTMRSIVAGLSPEDLGRIEGVTVIGERPEGIEIETPRYAAFTEVARTLATQGADFVEIAGNDDILVTSIAASPPPDGPTVIAALPRQGSPGVRLLRLVEVTDLAQVLRDDGPIVEHIHDY
ncbi:hypothetical protein Rumeso_04499 [Rubellimicrobium mesophilum DSM 19309]|uniref:Uncharacterized protein n=1 Tax=Rubellimicrobium mesophilum DSM 19309 TaxID=442562 RepID=A0A017HHC0_9RHOB|nr:hypothetical protein [Rubellimicrobium mesophilum]EYD73902.1 hypothetical protein Rumeso_04499 [Rubellimicrobium mesophilum DSM 19309]